MKRFKPSQINLTNDKIDFLLSMSNKELVNFLGKIKNYNNNMHEEDKKDFKRAIKYVTSQFKSVLSDNDYNSFVSKTFNTGTRDDIIRQLQYEFPLKTYNMICKAADCKLQCVEVRNPYEVMFSEYLDELEIKYEYQKIFMNNYSFYCVDFYLTDYNIVCEIDGDSHIFNVAVDKDDKRTSTLKIENKVRDVWRFKNHEVKNNKALCLETIDILIAHL